ncbi:flavin-dependent monooxygenase QhpG [Marinobacterium sp. YM272]|uniref:flavin-dependent monooxygenase QhpG n=1 Tax=Marinobacterium sp. YM272 TaxID=3421654 RepID=UPI003D7FF150
MSDKRVVILGGGPAGAAVALGLRRFGYPVCVVASSRPFDAVEGVSDRVVEGMKHAGFERALSALAPPSPRQVTWNGQTSAANTERLVARQAFDQGLVEDMRAQGIEILEGRVVSWQAGASGHRVELILENGEKCVLMADFVVEARGRAAPASGLHRVKGAETLSLLQYWQGPTGDACSAVENFADGWAWMAKRADGRRYLQLTLDVGSTDLPPKQALSGWCQKRFEGLAQAQPYIRDARPVGEVQGRISTPILCERSAGDNWLRVGDAAMAVDPLSGNGIFQALSSALQAPAVINTLLRHPERRALARQFHEARIDGLFYRFARIGRDFYAQDPLWPDQPFWASRRHWPDDQPLHAQVVPDQVSTGLRPVVENGLIIEAEVVITPDQPLGVWHLNGLQLAPLLDAVRAVPGRRAAEVLAEQVGPEHAVALERWFEQQNWIPTRGQTQS